MFVYWLQSCFADDTKLYRQKIHDLDDCKMLQDDLNYLAVLSNSWLLRVNAGKCVVLKIQKKFGYSYSLNSIYICQK